MNKDILIASALALFCSFFLIPVIFTLNMYPLGETGPSWMTLDPSWKLLLNKTSIDGKVWGKDFVLTYGPLSYLSTRVGWGISSFHFLLFDLFMFCNFFFIFFTSYIKSKNKWLAVLLITFSSMLFHGIAGSSLSLILMTILVFWILQSTRDYTLWHYLVQTVILTLVFFIKFNSGLVCFVFYGAGIVHNLIHYKQKRFQLLFFLLLPFTLIALLSGLLHVSLPGYIKGGIEMVTGYNGIMYLDQGMLIEFLTAVFIVLLLSCFLLFRLRNLQQSNMKSGLTLLLFCTSAFVLYKQGFVRADDHHIREFYSSILFLVVCVPDFYQEEVKSKMHYLILFVILASTYFEKHKEAHPIGNLLARFSKINYLKRLTHYTDTSGMYLFSRKNFQLPPGILKTIGNARIDIYPWNSQLLIENNLNYTSRPVSQSYSAYTPYLENLNFQYYNQGQAPDYILYELDAIDNRYALFDEPQLNLYILRNYSCIDTFNFAQRPLLLLQKKKQTQINFQKIREYDLKITDRLTPKENVFYELKITNSLIGKLVSVVRYEPELNLLINMRDGSQRTYRSSKHLLESGIFLTRHLNSTLDVYKLLNKDNANAGIEIISYSMAPSTPSLFNDIIKVTEFRIPD